MMDTLIGRFVRLEPLVEVHREPLRLAAEDERIWEFNLTTAFGPAFDGWFDAAQTARIAGTRFPYAVVDLARETVVGSTSFYDWSAPHKRVEIGHTWYHPSSWRTAVNPECKLLLLRHAFETHGLSRVGFHVDATNRRSRAAVTKLGAVEEGILRHQAVVHTGRVRDTVVFSILQAEWPAVRERLMERLSRPPA